jgi:hypothetical protein
MRNAKICSRCHGCIVEPGSIVKVIDDPRRPYLHESSTLCEDCRALLGHWLSGDQGVHATPWNALETKHDALPRAASR